ncbi:MAG: LPS export ABC transporter periplasmic protein LptC [Treponema sp.]|nr:LPS export ABC transporter periplasmic protein LptC [Treponema sp.]
MIFHRSFIIPVFLLSGLLAGGCSLKYSEDAHNTEDKEPEFIFSGADFKRYENSKNTVSMHARKLEQYKGGSKTYADDVNFTIMDDDGNVDTDGSCGLLASDSESKKYSLYNGIQIFNHSRKVQIIADQLRWNGKNEQLTSGRNDTITIKKEGTTIRGSGFSASGVSNEFAFTGAVSGTVDTNDENTDKETGSAPASNTEKGINNEKD